MCPSMQIHMFYLNINARAFEPPLQTWVSKEVVTRSDKNKAFDHIFPNKRYQTHDPSSDSHSGREECLP